MKSYYANWFRCCTLALAAALVQSGMSYSQTDLSTSDVQVEEEVDREERVVVYPNDDEEAETPTAADGERLERRAGEEVAGDARGRSVVLGMHLQEVDGERARVVEVAPATPAFEAGIKEGDEIASFDGFKADTYREWIDGIRRLLGDANERETMPVEVFRDGERLTLRVRKPVSRADDVATATTRTSRDQQITGGTAAQQPALPGQQPLPRGGGGDFIGTGVFGPGFAEGRDGVDRAMAQIFRLDTPQQPVQGDVTTAAGRRADRRAQELGQQNTGQQTIDGTNQRIGIAGFQDDPNGMVVMLDIGGLEPGTYNVSIGELSGAGIGGAAVGAVGAGVEGTAAPGPIQRNGSARPQSDDDQIRFAPPQQPTPPGGDPRLPAPNRNQPPQPGASPPPADSPSPPANQQGELELPRHSVLAQVGEVPATDSAAPQDSVQQSDVSPSEPRQASDTPATGEVNRSGATPTGESRNNEALETPTTASGGLGGLMVGVLTVDASGTGRMQQLVESVRVRNVVGQSIIIEAAKSAGETPLPPDLDVGAAPLTPGGEGSAQRQPSQNQQQTDVTSRRAAQQAAAGSRTVGNTRLPVAAGVIEMLPQRPVGSATPGAVPAGGGVASPGTEPLR